MYIPFCDPLSPSPSRGRDVIIRLVIILVVSVLALFMVLNGIDPEIAVAFMAGLVVVAAKVYEFAAGEAPK
jgi:hypothetical protein